MKVKKHSMDTHNTHLTYNRFFDNQSNVKQCLKQFLIVPYMPVLDCDIKLLIKTLLVDKLIPEYERDYYRYLHTYDLDDNILINMDFLTSIFKNRLLSNCSIGNCNFRKSIFEDATIISTSINNSNFSSANMCKIKINDCNFINSIFHFTHIYDSIINRTKFINCECPNINFSGSIIENVKFIGCNFSLADFLHAKMKNVVMINCKVCEYCENIDGLTLIDCNIIIHSFL